MRFTASHNPQKRVRVYILHTKRQNRRKKISVTHGDDWWCWWVLSQRRRGCWSRAPHQTAPRSRGKYPAVVCSRPPAPGNAPKKQTRVLFKDNAPSSAPWDGSACGRVSEKNLITRCAAHRWHDLTHISDSQHVCMRIEAAVIAWQCRLGGLVLLYKEQESMRSSEEYQSVLAR